MGRRCEAGSATETGQRRNNQDAVATDAELGYAVLADGMGGPPGGEVASRLAVAVIQEVLAARLPQLCSDEKTHDLLRGAIAEANRRILGATRDEPQLRGMGTTVVLALVRGNRFWGASVGDSRAYRLRDESLTQLSRDHSLVQDRVDAGLITPEEARHQPDRHVLTRALGIQPWVEADAFSGEIMASDTLLLTSDGVHDVLPPELILQAAVGKRPPAAARQLVETALARGGTDNATAAALRVIEPAAESSPDRP